MGEIYKRTYRVRKAAQRGKEITLAPETQMLPGEDVVQWVGDAFVLIAPKGTSINEDLLGQAIHIPDCKHE